MFLMSVVRSPLAGTSSILAIVSPFIPCLPPSTPPRLTLSSSTYCPFVILCPGEPPYLQVSKRLVSIGCALSHGPNCMDFCSSWCWSNLCLEHVLPLWNRTPQWKQNFWSLSYLKDIQYCCSSNSSHFPLNRGLWRSIATLTQRHLPHTDPVDFASTLITCPRHAPTCSPFSSVIATRGMLWHWTQKGSYRNSKPLTKIFSLTSCRVSKFLSKKHGLSLNTLSLSCAC